MNILVTGATGLIGSALMSRLASTGHHCLPLRRGAAVGNEPGPIWNPESGLIRLETAGPLEAVIHLAGENIAQRWTAAAKARIRSSRVDATRLLCEALTRLPQPPRVVVCASATGYYGDRGDEVLAEDSSPGQGFLAEVCQSWEAATEPARLCGMRVVHLRVGIVLARRGGALAKMLPAFRLGLGGRLGTGRQFWSWICLEDLIRVIELALGEESLNGAVNAVSPAAVTNTQFTHALAQAIGRPALLPMPAIAVKLLLGEMGREALLGSARVRPARLIESGFVFRFPELGAALNHTLGSPDS